MYSLHSTSECTGNKFHFIRAPRSPECELPQHTSNKLPLHSSSTPQYHLDEQPNIIRPYTPQYHLLIHTVVSPSHIHRNVPLHIILQVEILIFYDILNWQIFSGNYNIYSGESVSKNLSKTGMLATTLTMWWRHWLTLKQHKTAHCPQNCTDRHTEISWNHVADMNLSDIHV